MKKIKLVVLLSLFSIPGYSQTASVGSPHFDVQGPLYTRQNIYTLNKAANGWIVWGTRDTSTPEATINLSNINNAFFQGNIGIGTNSPSAKFHVVNSAISQTSTAKTDANLIIQGTSTTRSTSEGAALGFVVPTNTDGSNHWQQGRILVSPDNTDNGNAAGRMYLQTRYYGNGAWNWRDNLVLKPNGNVGIGTDNPDSKLSVNGTIHTKEVKVDLNGWSDFVFDIDYELLTLEEVENYITENKHLPEMPNEAEVIENGINLGEMNAKLLQKIEELTLYLIREHKSNQDLKDKVGRLEKELGALKNE